VNPQDMPGPLKQVSFEQHLGEILPLDTSFVDEAGTSVVLGEYFGERPVILTFVYYDCPMLCTLILNGLTRSLGVLPFDAGTDFDVVAISIDPLETPQQAREVAATTLARYDRPAAGRGWHFLTGSAAAVEKVTEAAGFNYAPIAETGEFAHASGIIIVSPEGRLSQYYLGVDYPPRDVRLALVEAASNNIGSVVDQLLLYCFRYNPNLGKYTAVTMRIVRLGGILFVVALFAFLMVLKRNETKFEQHEKTHEIDRQTQGAA
jgi:protein SCO1/2